MKSRMQSSLDRSLSGVQMSDGLMKGVLREIARADGMDQMKMKRKLQVLLACVLVGVVMAGALAFAASRSQILDWLFQEGATNQVAEQLLTQEGEFVEQNGMRLSLVETLYDKDRLMVTFEVENKTEQPVLLDEERMEGISVTIGGKRVGCDNMLYKQVLLGGEIAEVESPAVHQTTMTFKVPEGMSDQPAQVEFTAHIYKPLAQMKLDDVTKSNAADEDNWIYNGADTIWLDAKGCTNLGDYKAVWQAMQDITKDWTDEQLWARQVWPGEGLIRAGMAEEQATLTLDATITPDPGKQSNGTKVLGQTVFELPDYTLVVKELNFTSTGGEVSLVAYPKTPIERADDVEYMLHHPMSRWYALLDENGEDVLNDWKGAGSKGYNQEDGGFKLHWNLSPGETIPKMLTLVPIERFEYTEQQGEELTNEQMQAQEREHYLMEEAVTVELG